MLTMAVQFVNWPVGILDNQEHFSQKRGYKPLHFQETLTEGGIKMRFNKKMFVWMSIFVSFLLIGTYAVAKNNWLTDPEVNAPSISSIVIPGPKKPPKPH